MAMPDHRPPTTDHRPPTTTADCRLPTTHYLPPTPFKSSPTLLALAQIIVPHAFEDGAPTRVDLAALLEARLAGAPAHVRSDMRRALRVLDNLLFRVFVAGTTRPWRRLEPNERVRRFAALGSSRLGLARTLYEGVRRLVLATYYTTAPAHRDIGILAPLHTRKPVLSWEGPLESKTTTDDGVISTGSRRQLVPRASPATLPLPRAVSRGSELRGHLELKADVVVIGSGAGGAVAAAKLAEAGNEVVILEEGAYLTAQDFDEDEGHMAPLLMADGGMRATTDLSFALLQGAAVGGGTTVNWMLMLRTPDFVLDEWQRRFGLAFATPAALGPVFDQVEADTHAVLVPDVAHSPSNRVILDGARALGWSARAARINARGCVRAGSCTSGCRYDAKQSALLTYLPRAFARGARMFAEARVDRIEIADRTTSGPAAPRKRVHAVSVNRHTGAVNATLRIEAPIVILAAGAVGTPALLQRSGLGGGAVGRYLRLHPTTAVIGEYGTETYALAGIPQSSLCDEFLSSPGKEYGFWIEVPALGPAFAAAANSGFGAEHREVMRGVRSSVPLIALVRDGANLEMSNGEVRVDRHGVTRVSYRLGPADTKTVNAALEATTRMHFAAGAQRVRTLHTRAVIMQGAHQLSRLANAPCGPNEIAMFSAHVNGTCRMGTDPATSGASPEGERWGARGVYVCDGSLLPTSLGVNPQETIMALSSIVADGIAARQR